MKVKFLVDEDIANYQKVSMFIGFPHCTFKCDKENGCELCQNSKLAHEPDIEISNAEIIKRYINNPFTHALVLGGLEPFDDVDDLMSLLYDFRAATADDIVIYTGYTEDEIKTNFKYQFDELLRFNNVIIKYGRFRPNEEPHFDPYLGVDLMNHEQYAKRYN